jgi:hypothetical protein
LGATFSKALGDQTAASRVQSFMVTDGSITRSTVYQLLAVFDRFDVPEKFPGGRR